MGFQLCNGVLQTSEEKTEILKKYPKPHNKKALRDFLGFANYLRYFIPDYVRMAQQLYQAQNLKKILGQRNPKPSLRN